MYWTTVIQKEDLLTLVRGFQIRKKPSIWNSKIQRDHKN